VKVFKFLALAAIVTMFFGMTAPKTQAQVSVNIGVAPDCRTGYYDVHPRLRSLRVLRPEWFSVAFFIGVGPWFHGPEGFTARENRFHPEHGYNGPRPNRGDRPEPGRTPGKVAHFKETKCGMDAVTRLANANYPRTLANLRST